MSSNNGWISLHRKIRDNWIWSDSEKLKAWIDILLEVNHGEKQIPFDGHMINIKRGQKLTSLRKMADRWGWSRNRVANFIELLIEAGMVTAKRTRHGTLLTVVNYGFYQDTQDTNRATKKDTNGATNRATNGATDEAQTIIINNESNKVNNFFSAGAQKKIPPARSDVEEYCRVNNYHMDVDGFMTYYNMNGWTLSGGRKIQDWQAAVDYWHTNGKKLGTAETKPAPYFDEFENTPIVAGVESPFKNGAAAEMLRRKREKNVRQR